jgi:hypothetical protein
MRSFTHLTLALALLTFSACSSGPAAKQPPLRTLERTVIPGRNNYMGIPVKTGQLVLTEAPGPLSFFFNLGPEKFYRFTHAAILVMEDGEPFVYDIAGELSTMDALCAGRPTDAIAGKVRRNSFYEYCKPNLYAEVFDPPPGVDTKKMADFIQKAYKDETPFDPYFNHADKENLYCTQLIDLTLQAGGAKPMEMVAMQQNPSFLVALKWLAVPLDKNLPAGAFADKSRSVGSLGTFGSMVSVRSYYAAKKEIYIRFTKDQRLGNVFILNGLDIQLRDQVDRFVRDCIKLFLSARESPSEEVLSVAVQELADERFGYYERPKETPKKAPKKPTKKQKQ